MIRINLLPVRAARKKESIRFQLTVAGLITFFVIAVMGVLYITASSEANSVQSNIDKGKKDLQALQKKVGQLSKIKRQKQVVQEKLQIIDNLEARRTGPTELFNHIGSAVPERAWLASLKEQGRVVILNGFAATDEVVADFMRGLEGFKDFGSVELEVAQAVNEPETKADVVSFTIRLERKR